MRCAATRRAIASCAGLRTGLQRSKALPASSSRWWKRTRKLWVRGVDLKTLGEACCLPRGFCLEVTYFFFFFAFFLVAMVLFSLPSLMETATIVCCILLL